MQPNLFVLSLSVNLKIQDIMKKILLALLLSSTVVSGVYACTSAIISGKNTVNGRPLLWKHRDTGEENNKVERIPAKDGNFEYIGLYNATDTACREAWMGYNSEGFAIMNTASYNLKDDTISAIRMDKEGILMTKALKVCRTMQDFKNFLDTLSRPMFVEANFGVIDAMGNGGYFETNNYTYKFYDLADSPTGVLTRTNYSYSGRTDEGYGYIREQNLKETLVKYLKEKKVTPAVFTEEISRRFYHSLMCKDFTNCDEEWVIDQDFIPRRSSTATTVIEGVLPGEDTSLTTMWIGIGYPPCSEIRYVWLGENGVPKDLRGLGKNGHSELCDSVVARKHDVFSIKRGSGKSYVNLSKMYNAQGTGYSQQMKARNEIIYKEGYEKLAQRRKELKKKK